MNCVVGIDLGSTTTKAVVFDEEGRLLGRGITNSRSNYDVACAVARSEAFINARLALYAVALGDAGIEEAAHEDIVSTIDRHFRMEQHLVQQDSLRRTILAEIEHDKYAPARGVVEPCLERILDAMQQEVPSLFSAEAGKRSDFFRDIATSSFMRHAEAAGGKEVGFDRLMSVFDKSIIRVENDELDLTFTGNIRAALDRALAERADAWSAWAPRLPGIISQVAGADLEPVRTVGTGYGRSKLPFQKDQIRSEILCHGLGAHWMFPHTATVLDIGGQDTKAIQVDEDGIVTSFQMNDRCAAGCGRYLGYIADEMNLGVHELGPLAQKSCRSVRITSTCTVFAGAELRDRLMLGEKREDILSGLHRAMMLRAMSLLARSGGVRDEFTFTGGVANNPAAVDALRDLVSENYGERILNISPDSIYTGAVGAALFARSDVTTGTEAAA